MTEKTVEYKPSGVCSRLFTITYDEDSKTIIKFTSFGGCYGNLQGIGALIAGMKIEDVITRLKGIRCGHKNTSCPDQLAKALEQLL